MPPKPTDATMQNKHTTPITKRGLERRTALLQAADSLFIQHGFDNVALDDCVALAGGSKAAIYQHFGCKKGLLVAWVQQRSEQFFIKNKLPTTLENKPIRDVLQDILTKILNAFSQPEHIAFIRLIVREAQRDPEIGRISYELGAMRGLTAIAELLRTADDKGEISCKHPFESAVLFSGIFRYVYHRVLIGLPPLEDQANATAFFNTLIDLFLAAHKPTA